MIDNDPFFKQVLIVLYRIVSYRIAGLWTGFNLYDR